MLHRENLGGRLGEKFAKRPGAFFLARAVLLSLALLAPLSFAQQDSSPQTLEGVVSDGMCGGDHHGQPAAQCTLECVRKKLGWVLVVADGENDKVYTLAGRLGAGMNRLAGARAKVTGKVDGNRIIASQVEPAD